MPKFIVILEVEAESEERAVSKFHLGIGVEDSYPAPDDVWGEDEKHPRSDWQIEVGCGDTNLGYWQWVYNWRNREESEEQSS